MEIELDHTSSLTRFRFLIVNVFTTFNLLIGLLALLGTATTYMRLAAWCILLCVILDAFDGLLARRWEVTSPFGAQLDSLADMTSFMIASGALGYYWVIPSFEPNVSETTLPFNLIVAACALYVMGGAFRLARFSTSGPKSNYFQGMPTTMAAGVIAANFLVYPALSWYWVVSMMALLGLLMVTTLPYPKFSFAMQRFPNWVYLLMLVGVVLNLSVTSWVIMTAYLLSAPLIWLLRQFAILPPSTA